MDRTPVSSSNLAAVGYDPNTKILEIEFHGGSVYAYSDVPQDIFDELMSAESHGKYFNANIKDKYPYTKISGS